MWKILPDTFEEVACPNCNAKFLISESELLLCRKQGEVVSTEPISFSETERLRRFICPNCGASLKAEFIL